MHAISISALLLMTTGSPITQAGGDTVLLGHTAEIIAPWFACRRKSDVEFLKMHQSKASRERVDMRRSTTALPFAPATLELWMTLPFGPTTAAFIFPGRRVVTGFQIDSSEISQNSMARIICTTNNNNQCREVAEYFRNVV